MKRSILALLLGLLTLFLVPGTFAAPPRQAGDDWPIPGGHFYTQTAPAGYGGIL